MNRLHWILVGALGAGLVAIVVLGWRLAIHPMDLAYQAKLDEKTQLEAKLSEAKQRAAQFEKFQAEAENVRRDLEFYSRRLDEPLDTEQLHGTIDALVNSRSFRVTKGEIDNKANPKGGEINTLTLEMNCDLERLGLFLNDCVSQAHLVIPNNLDLTYFDDPEGQLRDTIKAKLVVDILSGTRGGK